MPWCDQTGVYTAVGNNTLGHYYYCLVWILIFILSFPHLTSALHGRLEVVQMLLERCGFEVGCRDSSGVIPLMDAARGDHVEVVQCLLKHYKVSTHQAPPSTE